LSTITIAGVVCLVGALVTSAVSARIVSQHQRGTPLSRLLLVIGLLLWIVAVFLLPPVSWISDVEMSGWLSYPIRVVVAYFVGTTLSRIWYGIVP
jgi:hypothetical protein